MVLLRMEFHPRLMLLAFLLGLSACNSLFFYPSQKKFFNPKEIGLEYEDVSLVDREGKRLHAWWLPAKKPAKGNILFLHGNAENITSHVQSVHWLPAEGWNVFLFDYQGYGESEGSPTFENCVNDSEEALRWLQARDAGPIVLLGQSLGASMGVNLASRKEDRALLRAAIVDSGFSSFRGIFRDKLGQFWLTWPFQYPLSLLVSSGYDPLPLVPGLDGLPLLFLHGQKDEIVPPYHSERMFEKARNPKDIWRSPDANHIQMLHMPEYRKKLLDYLKTFSAIKEP